MPGCSSFTVWARVALFCLTGLLCLGETGCVRRRLTIRTNPPGARVYVDDIDIGVTPVSTNFTYYATRKITIIKDGFRTETNYERVWPPWYEIPPLDFVSENLLVSELRDERVLDFQLVPQEIVPQERLLGRAEDLRLKSRQGIMTPLVPGQIMGLPPAPIQPEAAVGLPGQGLPENAPLPYTGIEPAR